MLRFRIHNQLADNGQQAELTSDLEAAVQIARSMLQGDGYEIVVASHTGNQLRLRIVATPEACEECLVPKEVLAGIIASTLPAQMANTEVVLTYPCDGTA